MIDRLRNIHIDRKDFAIKAVEVGTSVGLCVTIGWGIYRFIQDDSNISASNPFVNSNSVEIPYPEIVDKPYISVNYEQKTLSYESNKIQAEKIAGALIVGTKRIDKDNPTKETAQIDLVRFPDGEFRIDVGDKVLRQISISTGLDLENRKIILGIQYPIFDSKNTDPIDHRSLVEIELNEAPPTVPILAKDLVDNPRRKLKITFEKVDKITVYGTGNIAIVLDKQFIVENPATSRALFNFFQSLLQLAK